MSFLALFCHGWDAAYASLDTVHLYRMVQQGVALQPLDVLQAGIHSWIVNSQS